MSEAIAWGLLSALGYGATDFTARFAGRRVGVWRTMLYGQVTALLAATALLVFSAEEWVDTAARAPLSAWLAAGVSALVMLGATAMLYRGLAYGRLAVVAPVTASYGAVTAALEAVAGRGFPEAQLAGFALAICGAVLAAIPPRGDGGAAGGSGLGWALGAAACYGVGFWIQGTIAVPALGPLLPLWLFYAVGPVVLIAVARAVGQPLDRPRGGAFAMAAGTGLLAAFGYFALVFGYKSGAVALVTVLSSLASAVTVLLARVFIRERVSAVQWAGIAVLLAGLSLIHIA